MDGVFCYAYAEDILSCDVMVKVVEYCNDVSRKVPLCFFPGFPENKRGRENLKKIIPGVCNMARSNINGFILTDLDFQECSPELIREWFQTTDEKPVTPHNMLFGVAEKEVEAWLLADKEGLANYLGIAVQNFTSEPDLIPDPKQYLLNIIRAKGRKKYHKNMLPGRNANVGHEYNSRLCDFVQKNWDVKRAAGRSLSLKRAINDINAFHAN